MSIRTLLLVITALLLGQPAAAELWMWADSDGAIRYTNDRARIPSAQQSSALRVEAGMVLPTAAPETDVVGPAAGVLLGPPDELALAPDPFNAPDQFPVLAVEEVVEVQQLTLEESSQPLAAGPPDAPAEAETTAVAVSETTETAAIAVSETTETAAIAVSETTETAAVAVSETTETAAIAVSETTETTAIAVSETTETAAIAVSETSGTAAVAVSETSGTAAVAVSETSGTAGIAPALPEAPPPPAAETPNTPVAPADETTTASLAAVSAPPAAVGAPETEPEQRKVELQQQIARDEDALKALISNPDATDLEDSPQLHEIARRLPRLQAELRALERGEPAPAERPE